MSGTELPPSGPVLVPVSLGGAEAVFCEVLRSAESYDEAVRLLEARPNRRASGDFVEEILARPDAPAGHPGSLFADLTRVLRMHRSGVVEVLSRNDLRFAAEYIGRAGFGLDRVLVDAGESRSLEDLGSALGGVLAAGFGLAQVLGEMSAVTAAHRSFPAAPDGGLLVRVDAVALAATYLVFSTKVTSYVVSFDEAAGVAAIETIVGASEAERAAGLGWHPTLPGLFDTDVFSKLPWGASARPPGVPSKVPQSLADRFARSEHLWVSCWALAAGASPVCRLAAADVHGPEVLLTAGRTGFTPSELRLVARSQHLDDERMRLPLLAILERVWCDTTPDPDLPELLASVMLDAGPEFVKPMSAEAFVNFACGWIPGWPLSPHTVRALAGLASHWCVHEALARGGESLAVPQACVFARHVPALPRFVVDNETASRSFLGGLFAADLVAAGVPRDSFEAAAPKWSGSFQDLLDTLAAVESAPR